MHKDLITSEEVDEVLEQIRRTEEAILTLLQTISEKVSNETPNRSQESD